MVRRRTPTPHAKKQSAHGLELERRRREQAQSALNDSTMDLRLSGGFLGAAVVGTLQLASMAHEHELPISLVVAAWCFASAIPLLGVAFWWTSTLDGSEDINSRHANAGALLFGMLGVLFGLGSAIGSISWWICIPYGTLIPITVFFMIRDENRRTAKEWERVRQDEGDATRP